MVSYFAKRKKKGIKVSDEPKHGVGNGLSEAEHSRFSGFLTPALVLVPATDGVRTIDISYHTL